MHVADSRMIASVDSFHPDGVALRHELADAGPCAPLLEPLHREARLGDITIEPPPTMIG
jgi:hypothetical protein